MPRFFAINRVLWVSDGRLTTTLGMKGTMSEAELHMLRARLRGGILSKACRRKN